MTKYLRYPEARNRVCSTLLCVVNPWLTLTVWE
jgi:hypothetical protein